MPSWSLKTRHLKRIVLVLPGFNHGRGKRGAWFAWTEKTGDFFRKCRNRHITLAYQIFEPESEVPLSDGELQYLAQQICLRENAYHSLLYFQEVLGGMGRSLRNQGIRGLFLYLMMILSVKQFWIIILLWPHTLFANIANYLRLKKVSRTGKITFSFWERGKDSFIIEALNEAKKIYRELDNDPERAEPLRKYQFLRDHFKRKRREEKDPGRKKAYELLEEAYRDIICQLTGDSFLLKIVPKKIRERIVNFFHITENLPYPDNLFAVRNLYVSFPYKRSFSESKIIGRNRKVGPNTLEMFLLHTKSGEKIVVPCPHENILSLFFRADILDSIEKKNLPLEVVLYVGEEKEKEALVGFNSLDISECTSEKMEYTAARIQNALLDTFRQKDGLTGYYLRELPSVYRKLRWTHPLYLWTTLVHLGFPWLFISHGIPAFAIVACTWIFWDYLWACQDGRRWQGYFQNLIEATDKAYHNVYLRVMVHSALGEVNRVIREENAEAYRDVLEKIEEFHFPRKLRDFILLNNIVKETPQLDDFKKEANDFTTLPLPVFCYDSEKDRIKTLREIL